MDNYMISSFQLEEEEENDDTISLTNFPLSPYRLDDIDRLESSPSKPNQSDFFEFFTQLDANHHIISHAEDIIYSGKLIPFKFHDHHQNFNHQRSESSHDLRTTNYKKNIISRDSSSNSDSSRSDIRKTSSAPSSFRYGSNIPVIRNPKPWWHIMLFGRLSIHREMDLPDMKNRQVGRTSSAPILFPANKVVKKRAVNGKKRWGLLLKVLSCSDVGYLQTTSLK